MKGEHGGAIHVFAVFASMRAEGVLPTNAILRVTLKATLQESRRQRRAYLGAGLCAPPYAMQAQLEFSDTRSYLPPRSGRRAARAGQDA